jgi:fosfomycin resistance protein FosX
MTDTESAKTMWGECVAAAHKDGRRVKGVIQGLSHITFVVGDLERMARLLCDGLGAQEVYDSAGDDHSLSHEKFFTLGGVWIAAMEGAPSGETTYSHAAFSVSEADLPVFEGRLTALGVEIVPDRPRIEGEGRSLYFRDSDGHLFELHTGTLEARLQAYATVDS